MTAYYPSQAGYAPTQPVVYNSSMGYGQPYGVAGSYAQPAGGVMYVPSHGSRRSGRHRHHHYNDFYSVPQVATVGAPVVMVPSILRPAQPHTKLRFSSNPAMEATTTITLLAHACAAFSA
jgi:hypothetical protein